MKRKVSARKRKEEQKTYALTAVVLVAIAVFVAYTQAAISSTNSVLGKIAAQKSGGQQAGAQGISPQMGIQYNTQGYNALLNYYSTINLSDSQSKAVAGLDVELPCCGFKEILVNSNGTANFEASCHCGHHDAMY
ncbi:TPA: hypothetical protein H1012_04465, partial [archaeon]|nr:hypothetical protein [Candidatus Naiadarchaeales archaeon SRR2090159.bin1288]